MGSYLNPGSRSLRMAVNSQIYVDKSGLIHEMNRHVDTLQRFVCISRPRRFGKSMAADMLAAYYGCGEDTAALFDRLQISQSPSYREHLNRYDVLKINMQDFLSAAHSVDEMLEMLQKYLRFDLLDQYEQAVRFRDENNLVQVMRDIYSKTQRSFVILSLQSFIRFSMNFHEFTDNLLTVSARSAMITSLRSDQKKSIHSHLSTDSDSGYAS